MVLRYHPEPAGSNIASGIELRQQSLCPEPFRKNRKVNIIFVVQAIKLEA